MVNARARQFFSADNFNIVAPIYAHADDPTTLETDKLDFLCSVSTRDREPAPPQVLAKSFSIWAAGILDSGFYFQSLLEDPAVSRARNQGVTASPPQLAGLWFSRKTFRSVSSYGTRAVHSIPGESFQRASGSPPSMR